jgi:hypothetical protein
MRSTASKCSMVSLQVLDASASGSNACFNRDIVGVKLGAARRVHYTVHGSARDDCQPRCRSPRTCSQWQCSRPLPATLSLTTHTLSVESGKEHSDNDDSDSDDFATPPCYIYGAPLAPQNSRISGIAGQLPTYDAIAHTSRCLGTYITAGMPPVGLGAEPES